MKPTTIKDIAKTLNVNPSTVSRALKNHPDISKELREKIQAVAQFMNYQPNQHAVNFRLSTSKLIGLILPDISMYYYPALIKAVMEEVKPRGYHLLILQSGESLESEKENVRICRMMNVEGVLVSVSRDTINHDHFDELEAIGIATVFYDKVPGSQVQNSVTYDDGNASRMAVDHLIRCGVTRLVAVMGSPNLSITRKRKEGILQSVAAGNCSVEFLYCTNTLDAYQQMKRIPGSRFDGIFCMSDEVLSGTMRAVNENQLQAPKDFQIVAISDGIAPYYFNPPTTFIETSGYAMGQTAARELINLMEEKNPSMPRNIFQQTPLIINGSTILP